MLLTTFLFLLSLLVNACWKVQAMMSDDMGNMGSDDAMPTNPMAYSMFQPYVSELVIPEVIDMRQGGSIHMVMGKTKHSWGGGLNNEGVVYGYGLLDSEPSYPGPTILTKEGVPINVTWHNNISAPHILAEYIAEDLLVGPSVCYPECGVPLITHVHGMETTVASDGNPMNSFGVGDSRTDYYPNTQLGATLFYHDHADGLTRLNVWSGLSGAYIIEGSNDAALNVSTNCDIPLIIQDKLINSTGGLLYATTAMCVVQDMLPWVMESLGNVNLVNGVVMPFVNVPQQQCRLRLLNAANARQFALDIPFYDKCQLIATDGGLVKTPTPLTSSMAISLYPAERVELMCDFSAVANQTAYNVTNTNTVSGGAMEVIQFRVNQPSSYSYHPVAETLNDLLNLQQQWESSEAKIVKNIGMSAELNTDGCATALTILEDGVLMDIASNSVIESTIGTVEKWVFTNPTTDVHPFHIHLVHIQCGPNDSAINTNELKDTYPILMGSESSETTTVCYVATMPSLSLIVGSTVSPSGFGFNTSGNYVAHCHTLEHEDNRMMTFFALVGATRTDTVDNNGSTNKNAMLLLLLLLLLLLVPVVVVWAWWRYSGSTATKSGSEKMVPVSAVGDNLSME